MTAGGVVCVRVCMMHAHMAVLQRVRTHLARRDVSPGRTFGFINRIPRTKLFRLIYISGTKTYVKLHPSPSTCLPSLVSPTVSADLQRGRHRHNHRELLQGTFETTPNAQTTPHTQSCSSVSVIYLFTGCVRYGIHPSCTVGRDTYYVVLFLRQACTLTSFAHKGRQNQHHKLHYNTKHSTPELYAGIRDLRISVIRCCCCCCCYPCSMLSADPRD